MHDWIDSAADFFYESLKKQKIQRQMKKVFGIFLQIKKTDNYQKI